jgi:hypothetical protein
VGFYDVVRLFGFVEESLRRLKRDLRVTQGPFFKNYFVGCLFGFFIRRDFLRFVFLCYIVDRVRSNNVKK